MEIEGFILSFFHKRKFSQGFIEVYLRKGDLNEFCTMRRSRVVFGLAQGKFGRKNKISSNTKRRRRVVFRFIELFSDAPYIVTGVSTYQDVCMCGCHLNRFGQMNLLQTYIFFTYALVFAVARIRQILQVWQ